MSNNVVRIMKTKTSYQEKADLFFEYLKYLNKKEYDFFDIEYIGMNRTERQQFIDEIETYGIFVHEPPMVGNTSMEDFKKIFKDHPEWCEEYHFEGIEKPMVMGEEYFIRLKHETSNKASARSATNLNTKNLPAKSTLKKEKKVLMSQTPIRLGEMEVTNLLLAKSPETVEKLLKTYATNENLREQLINQLLDPGMLENGHIRNSLNMDIDADLRNNKSISREILEKYLNVLGYSLIDSYDDENQPEGM